MWLMTDRSPQKTLLKSPAVRIATPKRVSNLDSPSRVKRMLSFTELDNDFDDDILNAGRLDDIAQIESPTEALRSTKRKGLTQQPRKKIQTLLEDELSEDEPVQEQEDVQEDYYAGGGFGGDYDGDDDGRFVDTGGDDAFADDDQMDDQQEISQENLEMDDDDEEDMDQEPTPPPVT